MIHQPSGGVFASFDDLTLLSEGECTYHGPICDLDARLRKEGFRGATTSWAAHHREHAVETVSAELRLAGDRGLRRGRVLAKLSDAAKKSSSGWEPAAVTPPRRRWRLLRVLARAGRWRRSRVALPARPTRRFEGPVKAATAIKAAQQVMTALIYGGIYDLDDSQRSIQDRFGLLRVSVLLVRRTSRSPHTISLPSGRRRRSSSRSGARGAARPMCGALPYLFSKVAAELRLSVGLSCLFGGILYPEAKLGNPSGSSAISGLTALNSVAASALGLLVGSVAPSTDAALAMFPPIIVLDDHFQRQQHQRRVERRSVFLGTAHAGPRRPSPGASSQRA